MARKPGFTVLIVDKDQARSERIANALIASGQVRVLDRVVDLHAAYNLTEHAQPDLVLMFPGTVKTPEFPMFAAMLQLLRIRALILPGENILARRLPPGFHYAQAAELKHAGGLRCFVAQKYKLPAPDLAEASNSFFNQASVSRTEAWKTVVLGASTGGIEALLQILSTFQENAPPTLIVQHISGEFVKGFAQRLNRHSGAEVLQGEHGMRVRTGRVIVAPGNTHHLTLSPSGERCRLVSGDPTSGHRPSVDVLFHSATAIGANAVGALLTGMGRDGAAGLKAIKDAGGATFTQDEKSSAVYGMPRAAMEICAAHKQLSIHALGPALIRAAQRTIRDECIARL